MSMSFVEMREQAGEVPPKRSSRISNRISFSQQEYNDSKMADERARRGSYPEICDDSCLRTRKEFRLLEEYAEFKPQRYNFEVIDYENMKNVVTCPFQQGNLLIKCPGFHTLLDHTIAMIWLFYNDKKNWKKFTIPQVDWTLKFIDAIKSTNGHLFTDMETIRSHLEELLFMIYSEVDPAKFTDKPPPPPEPPKSCVKPGFKPEDIPITLRDLFHNKPSMLIYVLGPAPDSAVHGAHLPENEHITKALVKLEEFEWKNIQRINDEIDMFELIKCIKSQMGTFTDIIHARDLSNLKDKIALLENKWLLHKSLE